MALKQIEIYNVPVVFDDSLPFHEVRHLATTYLDQRFRTPAIALTFELGDGVFIDFVHHIHLDRLDKTREHMDIQVDHWTVRLYLGLDVKFEDITPEHIENMRTLYHRPIRVEMRPQGLTIIDRYDVTALT